MATVDQIRTNIERRLRDTQLGTRIVDAINWARRYIHRQANWSWSGTGTNAVRTIAPAAYTSVTVTSASTSVTVDSNDAGQQQITTDLASGIGIYHYATFGGGGNRYYRIINRSYANPTATLTITPAFIGTTSSTDTMSVYFREYALPTDFVRMRRINDENGRALHPVAIDDLWYQNGLPTATRARPSGYALRGETRFKVIFDPIPDAVYSVPYEYETTLSDVAAGGTEASMVVPPRWHDCVEEFALYYLRHEYKDDDRASNNFSVASAMLSDMLREEITGGGQFVPVIESVRSSRGRQQVRRAFGRGDW